MLGGDQDTFISVWETATAFTFSGFSGTRGAGFVDCDVVITVVVGSWVVVGVGVVTGIRSPV